MSTANGDTWHQEHLVPTLRRFRNRVGRFEWPTARRRYGRQLFRGYAAFGVGEHHFAVCKNDVEVRVSGGFHQQIDVQIIRRSVEVRLLTSCGDLSGSVHAAHGHVFYLNACLASENLLQRKECSSEAPCAIDDQLLA